jgi:hypothetical protein
MRGVVFSDLVATIGAHRGALHDVIEARFGWCRTPRGGVVAAPSSSALIFDK